MPPLDPDDLAERAFDPDASESGAEQMDADDRATVDAYRRVIDAARSTGIDGQDSQDDRADEDAPAGVWASISGELFSEGAPREAPHVVDVPPDDLPRSVAEGSVPEGSVPEGSVPDFRRPDDENRGQNVEATVTPIGRARWRSPASLGAVAAAIVLLAGVIVFAANRDDAPPTETATVVAQAELGLLPPGDPAGAPGTGVGTAELERIGDRLDIVLQTTDVTTPPPGAHYEVWLLNRTGPVKPQSIGVMDSPNGTMRAPVPATIDTSTFDVVDISVEPDDGNHDHSGHSLLRGTLQ